MVKSGDGDLRSLRSLGIFVAVCLGILLLAFSVNFGPTKEPTHEGDIVKVEDTGVVYEESANVPMYGNTQQLGEKHPHIEIDGFKFDYNPEQKWFYYAGTDQRGMWLEYKNKEGKVVRQLATPTRRDDKGDVEVFDGKTWQRDNVATAIEKDDANPPTPQEESEEYRDDNPTVISIGS